MRSLINTALFGNFFIALCAAGLTAATIVLLGRPLNMLMSAFAAAATLAVYAAHAWYMSRAYMPFNPGSQRQKWIADNRKLLALLALASLVASAAIFYAFFSWALLLWLGHLAFIALAYTLPVLPVKNKWQALRAFPLIKVLLIAYVWAAVTVQLPALQFSQTEWFFNGLNHLFAERFMFILALAMLFDIRDISRDRQAGVITLPTLAGPTIAQGFSVLLLLVFCGMVVQNHSDPFVWPLVASGLAAILVVLLTREKRSELFYSGLADGAMLLQAMLVLTAAWLTK